MSIVHFDRPRLMSKAPSMFGRELAEQAAVDNTAVPVIVTKSISAVEAVGTYILPPKLVIAETS